MYYVRFYSCIYMYMYTFKYCDRKFDCDNLLLLQTTGSLDDVRNIEEQFIHEMYMPDNFTVHEDKIVSKDNDDTDGNRDNKEEGCGGVAKKGNILMVQVHY